MSLTTPLPTDASTPDSLTAAPADSAERMPHWPSSYPKGPRFTSICRSALAYQAGSCLLAIAVLLGGVLLVQWGEASVEGSGPLGRLNHSASALLPLCVALGVSGGILVLGFLTARRSLRPVGEIERQLHRLLCPPTASLETIEPAQGATALEAGWNRLIHLARSTDRGPGMGERLEAAVCEYRQRRGEQILNALTDGIAVTDEGQRITCANNALYSILAVASETQSLVGESIEGRLADWAGKAPGEDLLESGHRGHRVVAEITCPGDDSATVLRVCRTPLAIGNGTARGGFLWSVRDITQQKMADMMRDQFVNAATHELRTPMANIKAYAETLALGEVDDVEQQKMFCNVINDEVTRLARFIDDLLHLSRMEAGATTLQLQVTEMGRLLEETANKLHAQMAQKNLDFAIDLPGKLPELIVDKDKLAVAIINLLGNAAKYTPSGGHVRLHVALLKGVMQIDVEDTGIGIAAAELPKVLEKFYRSSDPRVHDETGSGLGLSLANEIIRLHGGRLTVSSELNKGSKFTIILPTTAE